MNNFLELKAVVDLQDKKFFIPSYQRGYRWQEKEVVDLLNDISEFIPQQIDGSNDKTWYCLQPIVIQENDQQQFEVIDGQQRLTTIYLILHYLNQRYTSENRQELFELTYQTRDDLHDFLAELEANEIRDDNIDHFFISSAYKTIRQWSESKGRYNWRDFESNLLFHTKVIWYESIETDPISIFTRINIGKIPLTNAELIKALFLNSSNFGKNVPDKVRLRQLEISTEWDRIEQTLQDDMFWYFINQTDVTTNRIEFIFDLMNTNDDDDPYSTFRFFNEKFKNKNEETIERNWLEIKNYFQRFQEWFNERELYHKIGFLLYVGQETIGNLIAESKNRTKTAFKHYLDSAIRASLKGVALEELEYGDKKVKTVLLLYNIQTMLNNAQDNSRFPFDIFKQDKWDIEHITSVNDKGPETNSQKANWLNDAQAFIEDRPLLDEIATSDIEDDFDNLYVKIIEHFNQHLGNDEDINDISNLALLDSRTNRGYKNAVFPVKRMTIIQREKAGTFIPLCTKNAFLKYFSEYPPKMSFWTQEDRENYFDDLKRVLDVYLADENRGDTNE